LGRRDVVETLRIAAAGALARGAPASAVVYFRRAVAEGAPEPGAGALLHELGSAEAIAQDPRATTTLEEALELTGDGVERARIGFELAQSRTLSAEWSRALPLLRDALAELDHREPDLALRIETWLAGTQLYDPKFVRQLDDSIRHWRALVESGRPAGRALALHLACSGVCRGMDRADALALIDRGLDGGRLLADEGSECVAIAQGMNALIGLDELDLAEEVLDGVLDDAALQRSVLGYVAGSVYRLWADAPRGRLERAEALLRSVVELCLEHRLTFVLPNAFHAGIDVLVERPGLDDITDLLESIELEPAVAATAAGAWIIGARGRSRHIRGEREAAIADLRAAGETYTALGFTNPIAAPWRSWLALTLGPDAADEAVALAEDELGDATAAGLPRAQGSALRALGCVTGGGRGIEALHQSLTVLEAADAPVERARTLVELGAALRRANHRLDSRERLRAGLELAHRCGAERLANRATEELRASGGRPRRRAVSGPDALTASEARVAHMAAEGMTNREIAQILFVTAKTVENQLGTTYTKLGVRSRSDLQRALAGPESRDSTAKS
jgi:DNA-binding CsgD family transcriptional regulator